MNSKDILIEATEKYSEWLEMAGENAATLLNQILANMLSNERDLVSFYRNRLRQYENSHSRIN